MYPFKSISLQEIPTIISFFFGGEKKRIEKALTKACNEQKHSLCYAIIDNMIVLREEISHLYIYSMPQGEGNIRLVLMSLMEEASVVGNDWLIVGILQQNSQLVKAALPRHFSFVAEDKYSYLSLVQLMKYVSNEPSVVAVPLVEYGNSLFYNNEQMIPAPH